MGEDPTGRPNNLMPYVAQVAVGEAGDQPRTPPPESRGAAGLRTRARAAGGAASPAPLPLSLSLVSALHLLLRTLASPLNPPRRPHLCALEVAVGRLPHVTVFGDDYDTPDGTGVRG